jgi:hypothetical protein
MQDGSVTVERRKRGPDVWCFRWRESGPDGRRIQRQIVLGTADDLRGIASARKAVVGLRREINANDIRVRRELITLADLSRHFQQRELADRNPRIAYFNQEGVRGLLGKMDRASLGRVQLARNSGCGSRVVAEVSEPGSRNALQNTECDEPVVQSWSSPRTM